MQENWNFYTLLRYKSHHLIHDYCALHDVQVPQPYKNHLHMQILYQYMTQIANAVDRSNANKKLIKRWDSERELFYVIRPKATEFGEIRCC